METLSTIQIPEREYITWWQCAVSLVKWDLIFFSLGKHRFLMGHEWMSSKGNPSPVLEENPPLLWKEQEQKKMWWAPVHVNFLLDLYVHREAFTSVSEVYIILGYLTQSPQCKDIKIGLCIVRLLHSACMHSICSRGLIALSEMLMNSTEVTASGSVEGTDFVSALT